VFPQVPTRRFSEKSPGCHVMIGADRHRMPQLIARETPGRHRLSRDPKSAPALRRRRFESHIAAVCRKFLVADIHSCRFNARPRRHSTRELKQYVPLGPAAAFLQRCVDAAARARKLDEKLCEASVLAGTRFRRRLSLFFERQHCHGGQFVNLGMPGRSNSARLCSRRTSN